LEFEQVAASLERLQVVADHESTVVSEWAGSSRGDNPGGARVCVDLGYSWPSEARPAKERQGAVATQLANFVNVVQRHAAATATAGSFKVCVCGPGTAAIAEKLLALAPVVEVDARDLFDSTSSGDAEAEDIVYLSPDANDFLDTSQGWPRSGSGSRRVVFVVGGIVDRKVKHGRSAKRAADASQANNGATTSAASSASGANGGSTVRAVQLPLAADDLGAPLNIDTVLTMLFYWKTFDDQARAADSSSGGATVGECAGDREEGGRGGGGGRGRGGEGGGGGGGGGGAAGISSAVAVGEAFEKARHCAMFEHWQRHPQQGKHIF
jgi:hypothetical protein